jgi:hypothetical protein
MALSLDIYSGSRNKFAEDQNGNKAEVIRTEDVIAAILASGPGHGLKANVLAALTVKMLTLLLQHASKIEDAVSDALAICPADRQSNRKAVFAIVRVRDDGTGYFAAFGMPAVVFLHRGRRLELDQREKVQDGITLREGNFLFKQGDILTVFSKGVVTAGRRINPEGGWGWEQAAAYLEAAYRPRITAERLTELLLTAACSLDNDRPDDDLAVLTIRAAQAVE